MSEPKDKLLEAFNHMVDEMHGAINRAEEKLGPTLEEMVSNAEKMSKEVYALTQDEMKSVSEQVKREISNAREYMKTEGHDLNQWLKFDFQRVEDNFTDFLSKAADRNWLDFHAFTDFQQNTLYKTGEICGSGTLRCLACDQEMKFTRNTRIPPCPSCHHTDFERVVS